MFWKVRATPRRVMTSGERRTLRLVARHADLCNIIGVGDAATVRHKLEVLREHCESEGRDMTEIVKTAQKKGCDLILMASHGRRGLEGLLLGSETQKVLTHSKVPVLVFR